MEVLQQAKERMALPTIVGVLRSSIAWVMAIGVLSHVWFVPLPPQGKQWETRTFVLDILWGCFLLVSAMSSSAASVRPVYKEQSPWRRAWGAAWKVLPMVVFEYFFPNSTSWLGYKEWQWSPMKLVWMFHVAAAVLPRSGGAYMAVAFCHQLARAFGWRVFGTSFSLLGMMSLFMVGVELGRVLRKKHTRSFWVRLAGAFLFLGLATFTVGAFWGLESADRVHANTSWFMLSLSVVLYASSFSILVVHGVGLPRLTRGLTMLASLPWLMVVEIFALSTWMHGLLSYKFVYRYLLHLSLIVLMLAAIVAAKLGWHVEPVVWDPFTTSRVQPKDVRDYPLFIRLFFWKQKWTYGKVLEPGAIWARSPLVFSMLALLYGAFNRSISPLSGALRSFLTVRVSQINHCKFCVDINSATLAKRGVPMEKIYDLPKWRESALYTEKERAALDYAEAMTITGRKVTDEMFAALREHFDDDALVELTGLIVFQNLSSKFNSALDIPPQGFCLPPTKKKKK